MIIGLLIYFLYGKEHSVLGKRFPAFNKSEAQATGIE